MPENEYPMTVKSIKTRWNNDRHDKTKKLLHPQVPCELTIVWDVDEDQLRELAARGVIIAVQGNGRRESETAEEFQKFWNDGQLTVRVSDVLTPKTREIDPKKTIRRAADKLRDAGMSEKEIKDLLF